MNITGDPTYRTDFARYLAAELACNPWSDAVTVDCVGVAGEVAALNPDRHPSPPAPARIRRQSFSPTRSPRSDGLTK